MEHDDVVRDAPDTLHDMRHDDVRHSHVLLEAVDQAIDPRGGDRVESGRGLVVEEEPWIEGQGSRFHASYAGVSLGLLHGAQPDALVLCHEPTRAHMRGLPDYPLPGLKDCIALNLEAARLTNPDVSAVGVAINTSQMPDGGSEALLRRIEDTLGLPAVDPFRDGVAPIVDRPA